MYIDNNWYLYNDIGAYIKRIGSYEEMLEYKNNIVIKLGTMYFYG